MASILIAGDDLESQEILSGELAGLGHTVLTAANGQEAYELALARLPDAVILAEAMSVFNGYETCRLLRGDPSFSPTLPVILTSGEPRNARQLEAAGATGFLPSRHEAADLRELLSEFMAST